MCRDNLYAITAFMLDPELTLLLPILFVIYVDCNMPSCNDLWRIAIKLENVTEKIIAVLCRKFKIRKLSEVNFNVLFLIL
jgi:hypothetical protein